MDILPEARQLLQPLMDRERRNTWLTLTFRGEHRAIYDAIDQHGATTDFTVRCVSALLNRGCVGGRHALSLLLETVRGDAGDQLRDSFQSLIDELDSQCSAIPVKGLADTNVAAAPEAPRSSTLEAQSTGIAANKSGASAAAPRFPADPSQRPANGGKRDFFVSHTGADKDWAEWIAWQLEEAGYSIEIQAWDFHAGGNFILDMHRAASTTQRTIAVLSSNYLAARYTHPEWAAAFAQDPTGAKRTFIPVRVSDCQPDGVLRAVTYVDLVELDEATARQALLARISGERLKPSRPPGFPGTAVSPTSPEPGFPGQPQALAGVRTALLVGQAIPEFDEKTLQQILRHSPHTLEDYRLARIAEWSQPRFALDKRFTKLTLLVDQGPEAQGVRWQAQ